MIMRIFRARVKPGRRDDFERLVVEKSVPIMRKQSGLITIQVGRPMDRRPDEFVLVSVWKDLASLKTWTGENWNEVVPMPGEADLIEEATLQHYAQSEEDVYRGAGQIWRIDAEGMSELEAEAMETLRLTDEQWELIRPLLPAPKREGRPRADDRRTLEGILYVLRAGCRWQDMPQEYGSPVTCWRRYSQWQADGTWTQIWTTLLQTLDARAKMAWARAFFDGTIVPAKAGRRFG